MRVLWVLQAKLQIVLAHNIIKKILQLMKLGDDSMRRKESGKKVTIACQSVSMSVSQDSKNNNDCD